MSKIVHIPTANEKLIEFWSEKYGPNETIIISEYVKKLALQFPEKYKQGKKEPFDVVMTIKFHLKDMHLFFPELTKILIKKALESLKKQGLIDWYGDIKKSQYLFILEHENLVKELLSFEEDFYE